MVADRWSVLMNHLKGKNLQACMSIEKEKSYTTKYVFLNYHSFLLIIKMILKTLGEKKEIQILMTFLL